MIKSNDSAPRTDDLIDLGVFTTETKGQANLPSPDGVQQQYKIPAGIAAD